MIDERSCLEVRLLGSERDHFGTEVEAGARRLGDLARIAAELMRYDHPVRNIQALSTYLFRECRFQFRCTSRAEDFTLTRTVLTGGGNCLGLTTLFAAVALRLDLPVVPLLFEGHISAGMADENGVRVIELSRGGMLLSDRMARVMHGFSPRRVLSEDKLIAVHYSNRAAFVLVPDRREIEALAMLDAALDLFPDYIGGRINRATLLLQMGRTDEAVVELERIFLLGPGPRFQRVARALFGQVILATDEPRRSICQFNEQSAKEQLHQRGHHGRFQHSIFR